MSEETIQINVKTDEYNSIFQAQFPDGTVKPCTLSQDSRDRLCKSFNTDNATCWSASISSDQSIEVRIKNLEGNVTVVDIQSPQRVEIYNRVFNIMM